ncbi:MAG: MarR family transcriptional regulator [Clostridia bacterium]|nr:MarR family transcriptional regulator [Clostridia bacterium]
MMENILEANKKMLLLRRGIMHHMLTQYGLHPGQPEMLCYVQMHPGCSQRQIAEDAGVSAASIAASFKRMENAGLIRRRTDTADLRCNRVYITERGESAIQSCMRDMERLNQQMLQDLNDEEMETLLRCLSKINQNLSQIKEFKYPGDDL